MNEQPTGQRPGDDERADADATTDQPGTHEHAAGDQPGDQPGDADAGAPAANGTPSMSMPAEQQPAYASPAAAATTVPVSRGGAGGRTVIMVVLALIVGALVGGGVVAATRSSNSAATTGTGAGSPSTPSVTPTEQAPSVAPSASPATTVVIPAICLNLTTDAQKIVDLSAQAAQAARDLKASRLSSIVRELDTAQQLLRKDTAACRAAQNGA